MFLPKEIKSVFEKADMLKLVTPEPEKFTDRELEIWEFQAKDTSLDVKLITRLDRQPGSSLWTLKGGEQTFFQR